MAFNLTKNAIKRLNREYGIKLDFNYYLKESKKGFPDAALVTMFGLAYEEIYLKDTLDIKGDSQKCANFFNDFNNLVYRIREETPASSSSKPKREMGLKPLEQYKLGKSIRAAGPQNDIEAVMMNYEKGNIRIRDMRYFAEHIDEFGGLSDEKNRTILATYAEALKRYNAKRTTASRWLHPWRSNAETRDAKIIENILKNGSDDHLCAMAIKNAENNLSAGERIEKACLQSSLKVEKLEDYVEVAPDPNLEEMEDWEIEQKKWQDFLAETNAKEEAFQRQREEELKQEQDKEKQEQIRREKEKENIKKQREEEKRQKEEKIRNNPDAAKSPEQIQKEAQDEINNFLANLNAQIKQREEDRKALSTHLSLDELKEDIYANNEENSKIEESSIENPNLNKEP